MQANSYAARDENRAGGNRPRNDAEQTAVAALRSGCSFGQAAEASGLSPERVRDIWETAERGAVH